MYSQMYLENLSTD